MIKFNTLRHFHVECISFFTKCPMNDFIQIYFSIEHQDKYCYVQNLISAPSNFTGHDRITATIKTEIYQKNSCSMINARSRDIDDIIGPRFPLECT